MGREHDISIMGIKLAFYYYLRWPFGYLLFLYLRKAGDFIEIEKMCGYLRKVRVFFLMLKGSGNRESTLSASREKRKKCI